MEIAGTIDAVRDRIVSRTASLFAHAPNPLENTMEFRGDPGLLGPDSVSWRVIGDTAAFIGGIRALLIQAAHPEVAASLGEHSRYKADPLGRLSRTSAYVTATTYGAMPEVETAVAMVRRAHRPVVGVSHRGEPYSASMPGLAAWVHNALTDSFLEAYQVFGPTPLTTAEADRFVEEQTKIGLLLDADPLPRTAESLRRWIVEHPCLERSPGMAEAVDFLRRPPLPWIVLPPYKAMARAAAATIDPGLRDILGLRSVRGSITIGRRTGDFLRWSLGSSPSWHLALVRAEAAVPHGVFRQPLPAAATTA